MKELTTLSDEQLRDRAGALAQVCETISDVEGERSEKMKEYKQQLDALEKERARLARIVRTHQEEIEVEPPLLQFATAKD